MRHQLLMLWIISFLVFGCVFSDDSTVSSSSSATVTILESSTAPVVTDNSTIDDNCLKFRNRFDVFEEIIQNFSLLNEFMNQGLNDTDGNGTNFLEDLQKIQKFSSKFIEKLMEKHAGRENIAEKIFLNDEYLSDMIELLLGNETAKKELETKIVGNISEDGLANLIFEKRDSIKVIAKNDTQVNAFMESHEFRGAAIHKILKNYQNELKEDAEFDQAIKKATQDYLKNSSSEAMHMVLKENPDYTLILKLLILSPMIIAWTASLICIAVMCGVCYPFGLSESSTKSKSKDKKGRKSTDEKKGKKKSGNDE